MNRYIKYMVGVIAAACLVPAFAGCAPGAGGENVTQETTFGEVNEDGETRYSIAESTTSYEASDEGGAAESGYSGVVEGGSYTSMAEVSEYIHEYGHLPDNYITKSEAKKLGWNAGEGNLWTVAPGMSIGGDSFGNREGLLPKKSGRKYYECDIDYTGGNRNAKRLIYSNDGLVYYTEDHYNSFDQIY